MGVLAVESLVLVAFDLDLCLDVGDESFGEFLAVEDRSAECCFEKHLT